MKLIRQQTSDSCDAGSPLGSVRRGDASIPCTSGRRPTTKQNRRDARVSEDVSAILRKGPSVVVPCFDEEAVIRGIHRRLTAVLGEISDLGFEFVYVDDGRRDATLELLRELQNNDSRVRVIALSRNFGHQVAVSAGLAEANGDAVALIDADLQDLPEVLLQMLGGLARWRRRGLRLRLRAKAKRPSNAGRPAPSTGCSIVLRISPSRSITAISG